MEKRLCWLQQNEEVPPKSALQCVDIANKADPAETVLGDVKSYEISLDLKKLLVSKDDDFYILSLGRKSSCSGRPESAAQSQD